MSKFLVLLLVGLMVNACAGDRMVRPTYEMYNTANREQIWHRAVEGMIRNNNGQSILAIDHDSGVITTTSNRTMLLSPTGAVTYVNNPRMLSNTAADEEERVNLAFVHSVVNDTIPNTTNTRNLRNVTVSSTAGIFTGIVASVAAVMLVTTLVYLDVSEGR